MIWLDAHLSPRIARWLCEELGVAAKHVRELGLRDADDILIFNQAKLEKVIILSKDRDFADLVARLGPPPSIIWLRCGNTSEDNLKIILQAHLADAIQLAEAGNALVEIR